MTRFRVLAFASVVLSTGLLAQSDLKSRMRGVNPQIKNAGIYHVATGTWTRNGSLSSVTGPDTIYNNTCNPVYFTMMQTGDMFQHRSRIPSPSSPTIPTIVPGRPATDNDSAPSCQNAYLVNGFQVAYCSSSLATVDWRYEFASSYTACSASDMIPEYTVDVTGLPGGTPSGGQLCWMVEIDLSGGTSGGILLQADGDGSWEGGIDEFGFSFGLLSAATLADFTGPLIAGNFTWTGGPGSISGVLTPCTGTDGTGWDSPVNYSEPGTGMGSLDFFRATGMATSAPSGSGCYYFGGDPHADFWLQLYGNPLCLQSSAGDPGDSGVGATPDSRSPDKLTADGKVVDKDSSGPSSTLVSSGNPGMSSLASSLSPTSGFPPVAVGKFQLSPEPANPMLGFCYPNSGGTRSCPCANPPVPSNGSRGCNNFGPNPPGGSGGAILTGSGVALANIGCTLVFHVMGMQTPSTLVVLFSGSTTLSPGVQSGAGVRCVTGLQIPRPYKSAGGFNGSAIDFPSANSNPNVNAWVRSNSPLPGTTKHYYAAYRNPQAGSHPPCTPASALNLTNAGSITWHL